MLTYEAIYPSAIITLAMKISEKTVIELSKKLRQLKRESAERLKKEALTPIKFPRIVFPKFPYSKNNLFARTAPWKYSGFVIYLPGLTLVVDPGAEFETQAFVSGINPVEPNCIFVSHAHLDHYADVNTLIEDMSYVGKEKKITILASSIVVRERCLSVYHSNYRGKGMRNVQLVITKNNKSVFIGEGIKFTPISMFHHIEGVQGFILEYKGLKIGYTTDTGYTKTFETTTGQIVETGTDDYEGDFKKILKKHSYIKRAFKDVDILICNVNDFIFTKHSKYHLTGYDVMDILKGSKVKKCVIAHLNALDLTNNAFSKAYEKYINQESDIDTTVLRAEGLTLNLKRYFPK